MPAQLLHFMWAIIYNISNRCADYFENELKYPVENTVRMYILFVFS